MDKIANYKEMIYKEASNAVGRPDYSKAKTIHANIGDYTIRDAKLGEKIVHGAKNAYKAGKKGVKSGAKLMKTNPVARGAMLAAAPMPVVGHLIERSTDKARETNTKRHYGRDVLAPDAARELRTSPLVAGITTLGLAAGVKGSKAGKHLAKRAIIKSGIKGAKKADKIMNTGAKIGQLASITGGVAVGYVAKDKMEKNMVNKKLDKLSEKYLGRKATDAEHKKINNAYGKYGVKNSAITPESEVQKRRRQKERYKQQKKASEHLEEMCKEASSKWSKEDKKGYAKNVAIGVAQDFLNAGNPLNIGSSIVGSIADSLILERSSLNLNKKLKSQQASQSEANAFSKAMNVKNGTALPRAVDKKIK